jgi:hypothetical protein
VKTLSRWEVWLLQASNLLVIGTGLVYGFMRYLMSPADEWAVVNHPWQPHLQHLHVLTAPLLVFAVGLVWHRHVSRHYASGTPNRRRTGLTIAGAAAPMIASGYLLQIAVEPAWRRAWIVVHVTTSVLWLLGYLAHQLAPRTAAVRETHPARASLPTMGSPASTEGEPAPPERGLRLGIPSLHPTGESEEHD